MPPQTSSRMTLQDLILLIKGANLPARNKADMTSAVRKVASLLEAEPSQIPVDIAMLRRRLQEVSCQLAGVSAGRWNNIRSLFGKALALAMPVLPGRSIVPLLPQWQVLADCLPFNRRTRIAPLLRWLSERQITPDGLTMSDLEAYRLAIMKDRLRKNPTKTWDSLVWSWNPCLSQIQDWPQIQIPREQRRHTYTFPWDYYPSSLKQDVDAYLARLAGVSLSLDGPNKPARPATLKTRERQLRMAAAAAVHMGIDPSELTSLTALFAFERFQLILRFFLDRKDGQVTPQIGHLASFFKMIAKYWLRLDEEALRPYEIICRRLNQNNRSRGMTARNRERLRPLDDPQMVQRFLQLPFRIRQDVEKDRKSTILRRAVNAQIAAAIAILQIMPIRRRNIADIDMDQHLIARGKRLYLVIDGDDTKNEEPIDLEFPPQIQELLAWYVRDYRPALLRAPTTALFPGEGAGHKSASTLAGQIKRAIKDYLGIPFNMHLFRHAGTKIYLDVRPGEYEIMRRVLGHRSIETTTSTYAGAETRSAGLHFASVLAERRTSTELPRRVRPPAPLESASGQRNAKSGRTL
jgi:integrase